VRCAGSWHAARDLVNDGGDLAALGAVKTAHIRDPCNSPNLMCTISLCDGALASSASTCLTGAFEASNILGSAIITPAIVGARFAGMLNAFLASLLGLAVEFQYRHYSRRAL
jgi:hypothetical protein